MYAYVYQATLLCEDCAKAVIKDLAERGYTDTGDSDDWPQGPYSEGGGEADCPQHCDHCNVFLENPLTTDGVEYVKDAVAHSSTHGPDEWREFYDYIDFGAAQ